MTITTQLTTWPTTKPVLCELLGLDPETHNFCCGQTDKNVKCRNRVGKAKQESISRLLGEIIAEGSFNAVRSFLEQLSSLVLCWRHKAQGKAFVFCWEEGLEGKEGSAIIKKEEIDTKAALLTIEPKREEVDNTVQSKPSLSIPQIKVEVDDALNDKPLQDTTDFGGKVRSRRVSTSSFTIPEAPSAAVLQAAGSKHEFKPRSVEKTLLEINQSIIKLLLRSLSQAEQKICKNKGDIYIYTFPNNYRDPHPYLKIGFSKEPTNRMARWERQCGYKPEELSHHITENYTRVERLVHVQLENLRMIEYNGCPGCHVKHREWFDVRSTRASELVSLWCDWMRLVPYDEDGKLKQQWVDRLEDADLADPRCWNYFVNGEEKSTLGSESDLTSLGSESEFESEIDIESDSGCESGFLDVPF